LDDPRARQSSSGVRDQRAAAIAVLVFKFGGVSGAVRKIVYGWRGKFSAVQISIALQRRWPLLIPNQYQVADCLEAMERQGLIKCVLFRHSKIYERVKHNESASHHFEASSSSRSNRLRVQSPRSRGNPPLQSACNLEAQFWFQILQ